VARDLESAVFRLTTGGGCGSLWPLFSMGDSMTKADLAQLLHEKLGEKTTKKEAADLVNILFDEMKRTLSAGEHVRISGFGNFLVKEKAPRIGRNPQTGKPMTINGRRVLSFKVSQVLKSELNHEAAD
jgi:integration host factor subunit alpha